MIYAAPGTGVVGGELFIRPPSVISSRIIAGSRQRGKLNPLAASQDESRHPTRYSLRQGGAPAANKEIGPLPMKQTLFLFREGSTRRICFASSPSKRKLPPTQNEGGWVFVRQVHFEPDEPPRFGFDANEVQAEVASKGFSLRDLPSRAS